MPMRWLSENYKWLFDGVGGAVLLAVIGFVVHRLRKSSQDRQQPVANTSAQVMNSPTIKVSLSAPTSATPVPQEDKEQPPCLSFVQSRPVLLHQDSSGVWHEASKNLDQAHRGLVAQFRNRPNKGGQQAPKAGSVTASLIFKSPKIPEELHINHAAWLDRFEHSVSFRSGETHQLLLAVKLIPYVTFENPNTVNPLHNVRWRSGIAIHQPQASALADGDGKVEITLVDAWNVTVFTGVFDYRLSENEMYLKPKA